MLCTPVPYGVYIDHRYGGASPLVDWLTGKKEDIPHQTEAEYKLSLQYHSKEDLTEQQQGEIDLLTAHVVSTSQTLG